MKYLRRIGVLIALLVLAIWLDHQFGADLTALWATTVRHILRAMAAIAFAMLLDSLLQVLFWHGYLPRVLGAKVPRLLPALVSVLIYASVFFNLLKYDYGVSVGGAIAASGVVAVILGFALRSVILDIFTGLAVSVDRAYAVGDWITVSSRDLPEPILGQVEDIDWRVTRMRREDGTLFVMPNSLGGMYSILNHSSPRGPKREEFTILLPHETPNARVEPLIKGAVLQALEMDGFSTTPPPTVLMGGITKDGVEYLIRYYMDIHRHRPATANSIIRKAVHTAILQNSLVFPARKIDLRENHGVGTGQSSDSVRTLAALSKAPLFHESLTASEIESLASNAMRRRFNPGEQIIEQDAEGASLFLLLSGAATVSRSDEGAASTQLAVLATGDIVGEMSLLTGKPRSASVTAKTHVDTIEITKEQFAPILEARPQVAKTLGRLLAERQLENTALTEKERGTDLGTRTESFFASIMTFFGASKAGSQARK